MIATPEAHDALIAHEPTIERRYVDAALVEIDRRPELLDCYPPSLVASVAISEAVGIPVDSRVGAGHLSVQRQKGQPSEALFLPGYPAYGIVMRRDDPEIVFTDAQVVRARDDFRFEHTTAPALILPSRPRVSRVLQGFAALAGLAPVDGFRHIPYLGQDAGPVVAIYASAAYRSGVVKRVLMRREEFVGVLPETAMEEADKAHTEHAWGNRDAIEKLKGLAVKRLAKTVCRTTLIGALIYLGRGGERARYTPRSLDVCKTLGIFVHEPPSHMRGAPVVTPEIEEAAKDVDEERQAVKDEIEGSPKTSKVKRLCCTCARDRAKAYAVSGITLKTPCKPKAECKHFEGGFHFLCTPCSNDILKAMRSASAAANAPAVSVGMNVKPGDGPLAPDEDKPVGVLPPASEDLEGRVSQAERSSRSPSSSSVIPQAAPGVVLAPEANQKGSSGQGSSELVGDSTAEDGAVAQETAVPSSVDIRPLPLEEASKQWESSRS